MSQSLQIQEQMIYIYKHEPEVKTGMKTLKKALLYTVRKTSCIVINNICE